MIRKIKPHHDQVGQLRSHIWSLDVSENKPRIPVPKSGIVFQAEVVSASPFQLLLYSDCTATERNRFWARWHSTFLGRAQTGSVKKILYEPDNKSLNWFFSFQSRVWRSCQQKELIKMWAVKSTFPSMVNICSLKRSQRCNNKDFQSVTRPRNANTNGKTWSQRMWLTK